MLTHTMPGRAATTRIAWIAEDRATARLLRAPLLSNLIDRQHKVLLLVPGLTALDRLALLASGIESEALECPAPRLWPLGRITARRRLARTLLAWNARVVVADGASVLELAAQASRYAGIAQFFYVAPLLQSQHEAQAVQRSAYGMLPAFVSSDEHARQLAAWLPSSGPWQPQVLPLATLNSDRLGAVALPGLEGGLAFAALAADADAGLFSTAVGLLDTRAARAQFRLLRADEPQKMPVSANKVVRVQIDLANRDQVTSALAATHVVVIDGQSAYHRSALATALILGRPVLATDTPFARDLIDSGVNGWLVPAQADALATAMTATLKRPDLLPGMARAARQKAERHFNDTEGCAAVLNALNLEPAPAKAA